MRRPQGDRASSGVLGLALVAAVALAGCGIGANGNAASVPVASAGPAAAITGAVDQTRGEIANALASISSVPVQFGESSRPYRPPESGRLRDAPRAVFQVVLPDQPDAGFIVIYDFRDAAAAVDAGNEEAGYLGTGPARVALPRDAQHVLRQVGSTLVLYTWSPSAATDRTAEVVAGVLSTIGIGFTVPN